MMLSSLWIPLLLTFIAGLSTGLGSLISFFVKDFKRSYLHFSMGLSAGVMVYVSFMELLPRSVEGLGFFHANMFFFGGVLFIMLIDFLIPHEYIEERLDGDDAESGLMSVGLFTALGIAIHNFPEGLAVFMSSLSDVSLGVPLAFAIALHNIPEGIAVAMPIYYATKSRSKAFWYSFFSGVVEPLGAVFGALLLLPYLTEEVLYYSLAFVAGVMVFISFDELLPLSLREDKGHITVLGVYAGMVLMYASLQLL